MCICSQNPVRLDLHLQSVPGRISQCPFIWSWNVETLLSCLQNLVLEIGNFFALCVGLRRDELCLSIKHWQHLTLAMRLSGIVPFSIVISNSLWRMPVALIPMPAILHYFTHSTSSAYNFGNTVDFTMTTSFDINTDWIMDLFLRQNGYCTHSI